MYVKKHLCRSGHNAKTHLSHVWLGDDILDPAIQRFGRLVLAKRNVSFVPGPLEAKKRETKRRLAHVSQVNGGELGSFDPGLMTGINEKAIHGQWHWQAPGTSEISVPGPLTSWLGGLIRASAAHSGQIWHDENQAADPHLHEEHQDIRSRLQKHAFLSRLGHCATLDELRDMASLLEIDVRAYSSQAFQQIHDTQRSLRSSLDFLEDTSMDDPSAQNMRYLLVELLQQLKKNQIGTKSVQLGSMARSILIPWVKSQLSLGKRNRTDVEIFADFIRDLAQLKPFKLLRYDFARAVLEGLRSSTVMSFCDLTPRDRSNLLHSLMSGRLNLGLQNLGFSLAETVTNPALVSKFLAKVIHSCPASHGLEDVRTWQQIVFPRINDLLQTRSQANIKSIIHRTSRNLVGWQSSLPYDSSICTGLMDQWWSTIVKVTLPNFSTHGLGNLEIERSMPSDRPDALASYAVHLGGRKKARFVLSNWFAGRLSPHDFERLYNNLKVNLENDTQDSPFLCMLRTVHQGGLLQHDFVEHSFQLLHRMRMFRVMTEILARAGSYGIEIPPKVVMDVIQQLLNVSPNMAYEIYCCDPRIPIENLPKLAVHLIEHPGVYDSTVWHHQRMRAWKSTFNALGSSEESSRQSRAYFLEKIALAYSISSTLTARMARRQVMKCIKCWRADGLGPLSPQISRALVQAGIIRPVRERRWLSYDQLTWVLSVVRAVEGPKKADEIDHLLSIWREQLWKGDNPKLGPNLHIHQGRKPLPFVSRVKWWKAHETYHQVVQFGLKYCESSVLPQSSGPLDVPSRDPATISAHARGDG